MIEPQNSMMPLPADSAPAEIPQGEAGFGEMLAQTLGMVPQVDPNAVQRMLGEQGTQGEEPSDLMAGGNSAPKEERVAPGRYITLPLDGSVSISAPTPVVVTPVVDSDFVNPVFDGDKTLPGPVATTENPAAPQPANPSLDLVGDDGIWRPIRNREPVAEEAVTAQPIVAGAAPFTPSTPELAPAEPIVEPAPVVPNPRPEPGPVSPVVPVDTVPIPETPDPVAVEPVRNLDPVQNVEPVRATPIPAHPVGDNRVLPTTPTPDAARPVAGETVGEAKVAISSAPVADSPIELAPESPVRIGEARVSVPTVVPSGETATAAVESAAAPAPGGMTAMTADAVSPQATPVSNFSAPDAPVQNSALAERVIQAVQMQANQPPPRTMVVDIPEIEGLRLVVSVRAGAEVHVVPTTASTATDGLQPFLEEIQSVLENRGFVMTGDGRRRGNNPDHEEQPEPQRSSPRPLRSPEPTDNDLRI